MVEILAELKPGRELHTNVEFYAGVVMELCGLPREMFTPTFAVGRVIGWCANILEQAADRRSSARPPATSGRRRPSRCPRAEGRHRAGTPAALAAYSTGGATKVRFVRYTMLSPQDAKSPFLDSSELALYGVPGGS